MINEIKSKLTADPKIEKSISEKAYKLLVKFFKNKNLAWFYAHDWHLEDAEERWNDARYDFRYIVKHGEEKHLQPYPDAIYKKKYKIFNTPKNAIEFVDTIAKQYEGQYAFRGMSFAEYLDAKRKGYVQSKCEFNIGDIKYTYFANKWATAYSYSNGFAPYDRTPTREMPAAIIAIPIKYTVDTLDSTNKDVDYIPKGERVATEKIPFSAIAGLWIVSPVQASEGFFQLVYDQHNNEIRTGSMAGSMIKTVLIPKDGIALTA